MLERKTSEAYKKYTLLLLLLAITALVVCTAVFALKRDAVPAVQQNYSSHYSPKPDASQERVGTEGVSPVSSAPVPTIKPSPAPSSAPSSRSSPASAQESVYIVTLWAGKIGVFENGESVPVLASEVDTSLLPQEDLSILQKGIRVTSLSEARAILEDYE